MRATLTSKCQFTLPAALRRELGLSPGDQLDFTLLENGRLEARPVKKIVKTGSIMDLKGILEGRVPKMTLEEMDDAMMDAVSDHVQGLDADDEPEAAEVAA